MADVVVRFAGDTKQLDAAFQDAGLQVKVLGNQVKQSSGGMKNLGGAIGQAAFAAQDFTSILAMGGRNALGRALMSTTNNVQMLGAAFGPWGLAISAVGGALASVLIPKLFEGENAFDRVASSIEAAGERLKDFIHHQQELADFQVKFDKGDDKARFGMGEDVTSRLKNNNIARDLLRTQMKRVGEELAGMSRAAEATGGAREGMSLEGVFGSPVATSIRHLEIEPAIARLKAEFERLAGETRKLAFEESRLREMESKLAGEGGDLAEEQRRREARERGKDMFKERQGLVSSIATAREQFEMSIAKLADMVQRGVIDDTLFEKAAAFEGDKFSRSLGKPLDSNKAMLAGSAEAFSLITRTQRGSPQADLQRQLLSVAKDQLTELRKQNAAAVGADF